MEAITPFDIDSAFLLFIAAGSILGLLLIVLKKKGLLTQARLLYTLNEIVPWIFLVWFVAGLVSCLRVASSIGSSSPEVVMPVLWGIVAGPILFFASLGVRKHFRKYFDDV